MKWSKHIRKLSCVLMVFAMLLGRLCLANLRTDPLSIVVQPMTISSSNELIRTVNQNDSVQSLSNSENGVITHAPGSLQQRHRNLLTISKLAVLSAIPYCTNIRSYVVDVTAEQCHASIIYYIHRMDGEKG